MKSSTTDKIQGKAKQAAGAIKEKVGEVTHDPEMTNRGTAEKVGGKIQQKTGEVKKVFGK